MDGIKLKEQKQLIPQGTTHRVFKSRSVSIRQEFGKETKVILPLATLLTLLYLQRAADPLYHCDWTELERGLNTSTESVASVEYILEFDELKKGRWRTLGTVIRDEVNGSSLATNYRSSSLHQKGASTSKSCPRLQKHTLRNKKLMISSDNQSAMTKSARTSNEGTAHYPRFLKRAATIINNLETSRDKKSGHHYRPRQVFTENGTIGLDFHIRKIHKTIGKRGGVGKLLKSLKLLGRNMIGVPKTDSKISTDGKDQTKQSGSEPRKGYFSSIPKTLVEQQLEGHFKNIKNFILSGLKEKAPINSCLSDENGGYLVGSEKKFTNCKHGLNRQSSSFVQTPKKRIRTVYLNRGKSVSCPSSLYGSDFYEQPTNFPGKNRDSNPTTSASTFILSCDYDSEAQGESESWEKVVQKVNQLNASGITGHCRKSLEKRTRSGCSLSELTHVTLSAPECSLVDPEGRLKAIFQVNSVCQERESTRKKDGHEVSTFSRRAPLSRQSVTQNNTIEDLRIALSELTLVTNSTSDCSARDSARLSTTFSQENSRGPVKEIFSSRDGQKSEMAPDTDNIPTTHPLESIEQNIQSPVKEDHKRINGQQSPKFLSKQQKKTDNSHAEMNPLTLSILDCPSKDLPRWAAVAFQEQLKNKDQEGSHKQRCHTLPSFGRKSSCSHNLWLIDNREQVSQNSQTARTLVIPSTPNCPPALPNRRSTDSLGQTPWDEEQEILQRKRDHKMLMFCPKSPLERDDIFSHDEKCLKMTCVTEFSEYTGLSYLRNLRSAVFARKSHTEVLQTGSISRNLDSGPACTFEIQENPKDEICPDNPSKSWSSDDLHRYNLELPRGKNLKEENGLNLSLTDLASSSFHTFELQTRSFKSKTSPRSEQVISLKVQTRDTVYTREWHEIETSIPDSWPVDDLRLNPPHHAAEFSQDECERQVAQLAPGTSKDLCVAPMENGLQFDRFITAFGQSKGRHCKDEGSTENEPVSLSWPTDYLWRGPQMASEQLFQVWYDRPLSFFAVESLQRHQMRLVKYVEKHASRSLTAIQLHSICLKIQSGDLNQEKNPRAIAASSSEARSECEFRHEPGIESIGSPRKPEIEKIGSPHEPEIEQIGSPHKPEIEQIGSSHEPEIEVAESPHEPEIEMTGPRGKRNVADSICAVKDYLGHYIESMWDVGLITSNIKSKYFQSFRIKRQQLFKNRRHACRSMLSIECPSTSDSRTTDDLQPDTMIHEKSVSQAISTKCTCGPSPSPDSCLLSVQDESDQTGQTDLKGSDEPKKSPKYLLLVEVPQ